MPKLAVFCSLLVGYTHMLQWSSPSLRAKRRSTRRCVAFSRERAGQSIRRVRDATGNVVSVPVTTTSLASRRMDLTGADRRQEDETMPKKEVEKFLPTAERQAIFLALVEAQDGKMGVVQSRKEIAERFGISDRQLKRIEEEGIEGEWPPLTQ
jgi:hypothetical protein